MKIKEIIVVEGRDDTVAIKRAVDADTLETNGSAVGAAVIERIRLAQQRRGVIILTDPDYPGERIRHIVSQAIPGCKHAFLPKYEAVSKKGDDLGVENATPEAIKAALSHVKEEFVAVESDVFWQDLVYLGLIGGKKAKSRRERLGEILKIGYTNGKQLHKRLVMFQISKAEFTEAIKQVLEEEENE
ncbi:ribonuclease M5 [Desertibacillus haloalkaliphilus]|uniref:ribonuclease M5 n=1 Tax=Desertibacillus haloalkaliphilus TaxID=1328930 RepID=UPI001C25576E|nr:ribonuclease M5 [Desertibacillus haloalkaliphilus]MBU8908419.1 ribonuclease M5 [Desertibacillus haloalkaliphilus]